MCAHVQNASLFKKMLRVILSMDVVISWRSRQNVRFVSDSTGRLTIEAHLPYALLAVYESALHYSQKWMIIVMYVTHGILCPGARSTWFHVKSAEGKLIKSCERTWKCRRCKLKDPGVHDVIKIYDR